jgi:hypothetical protein
MQQRKLLILVKLPLIPRFSYARPIPPLHSHCAEGDFRSKSRFLWKLIGLKSRGQNALKYIHHRLSSPWPALCGIYSILFIWKCRCCRCWRASTTCTKLLTDNIIFCISRGALRFQVHKKIFVNQTFYCFYCELFAQLQLATLKL